MTTLRERKKQRTREHIAATARRLFDERGFDHVTVAQIAREADVAEKTVFNYFPTKEDLFYWRLERFEDELLATIRDRRPGESVLDAFRRFLLAPSGILARLGGADAEEARDELRAVTRIVTGSPALLAREAQIFARYTASLTALLTAEMRAAPGDVRPQVVANALLGVHRALIDQVRRRTLADDFDALARDVRLDARRAFRLLEGGFGTYGKRRDSGARRDP